MGSKRSIFFVIVTVWAAQALITAELRLTSPNGGEAVCLAQPVRITWTATGVSQKLKLILIRSGGSIVGTIASDLNAGDSSCLWSSAGKLATGDAPAGRDYLVRLATMDGSLKDTSDAPFELKSCGDASVHPLDDLQVIQTKPHVVRPDLPPLELSRGPRLRIREFVYDHAQKQFVAWVRNVGDASFVGNIRWYWSTPCGGAASLTSIDPGRSPSLDRDPGVPVFFGCVPSPGFCSMHASIAIEPMGVDGTPYERASAEKDFPCYEHGRLLLESRRLKFIFLNGSRWVDCGSQCVITAGDAYDYDPETGRATFTLGFPLKNCGGETARDDNLHTTGLNWYAFHTPSHTIADNDSVPWPPAPVEPGQGVFVENSVSLKVQEGLYMLTVYIGQGDAQITLCSISIRFADSLLH